MKLLSSVLLFHAAFFSSVPVIFGAGEDGGDSHDDHDHENLPECSEFNVTANYSCDTCEAWCEGAGKTGKCKTEDRHADTIDGLHVDVYEGFICECESSDGRALDEGEEMHCGIEHELPTCKSVGIGNCDNSTTTCPDYCISLGLGTPKSERRLIHNKRSLGHIHVCDHKDAHHEEEEEEGEHDHEGEEGYTICYCDVHPDDEGKAGKGLVSCADEGWEGEHDSHAGDGMETAGNSAAASFGATGGLFISAISASMYFW